MSKIWYNKTTNDAGIFEDDASLIDWPDFQEEQPDMTPMLTANGRAKRDELLTASDHMALADRITDEWTTYRQALRDVPAQAGFPTNVTWPTEPD